MRLPVIRLHFVHSLPPVQALIKELTSSFDQTADQTADLNAGAGTGLPVGMPCAGGTRPPARSLLSLPKSGKILYADSAHLDQESRPAPHFLTVSGSGAEEADRRRLTVNREQMRGGGRRCDE